MASHYPYSLSSAYGTGQPLTLAVCVCGWIGHPHHHDEDAVIEWAKHFARKHRKDRPTMPPEVVNSIDI